MKKREVWDIALADKEIPKRYIIVPTEQRLLKDILENQRRFLIQQYNKIVFSRDLSDGKEMDRSISVIKHLERSHLRFAKTIERYFGSTKYPIIFEDSSIGKAVANRCSHIEFRKRLVSIKYSKINLTDGAKTTFEEDSCCR